MNGTIKTVVADRGFGFIRCEGMEYFFHRSGLNGCNYDDIVYRVQSGDIVRVTFDIEESAKGPRANNICLA